jgi:hypothetical protein
VQEVSVVIDDPFIDLSIVLNVNSFILGEVSLRLILNFLLLLLYSIDMHKTQYTLSSLCGRVCGAWCLLSIQSASSRRLLIVRVLIILDVLLNKFLLFALLF